ncbi:hypothetical protein QQS21_012622 [Conoideocrella luteorostrata]|uniref:Uncharacterized protein n=1 Tax=Conoideocrella luteorostrata TaxID=1105319 RepID=A0AAJ0CBZ0_9HYPO|nr:hypothetical protein QQS21_012622 [Conoideocrella luteorostrata]
MSTQQRDQPVRPSGRSGWDTQPIGNPATANWDMPVSQGDLKKLADGFVPEMMEDKWLCFSEASDAEGNVMTVYLCRSWTRKEHIALRLQLASSEAGQRGGARITEITWERSDEEPDLGLEDAKELATMVCDGVLGCSLGGYED